MIAISNSELELELDNYSIPCEGYGLRDYVASCKLLHPQLVSAQFRFQPLTSIQLAMPGVFHWGPLTALTIITVVTVSSTYSALQLWGLPPSRVRYFRLPNFVFMYVWLVLILKNFYQALKGPGYVPLEWKPVRT